MEKNDAQIGGFAVMKKAASPWKKQFLKSLMYVQFTSYVYLVVFPVNTKEDIKPKYQNFISIPTSLFIKDHNQLLNKKKNFQLICTDKIYETVCGNFFKTDDSQDISLSVIFRLQKILLHHKIVNKTQSTKN